MRHSESFRVRFTEADHRNRVTPVSMYNYFQETAVAHGEACGLTPKALFDQGYAWILNRIHLQFDEYPQRGDVVEVETWGSSLRGLYAIREWRAKCRDAIVARATSRWVLLDVNKRRVVKLPQVVLEAYGEHDERMIADSFERLVPITEGEIRREFHVRISDLDTNLHANSGRYIDWCVESVPRALSEYAQLARLELIYKKEAVLGDGIVAVGQNGTARHAYEHAVLREGDETVLAYARSAWRMDGAE